MEIVRGVLQLTLCINTLGKCYCRLYVISFAQPAVIKMGPVEVAHSLCGFNSSSNGDSGHSGLPSVNKENITDKKTEISKATFLQFCQTACNVECA